jgi:hypothetical protein
MGELLTRIAINERKIEWHYRYTNAMTLCIGELAVEVVGSGRDDASLALTLSALISGIVMEIKFLLFVTAAWREYDGVYKRYDEDGTTIFSTSEMRHPGLVVIGELNDVNSTRCELENRSLV